MAENKKSVLLYCDIIHTVEELDDADAGLLFKHYLRYINDQNPEPPSKLIKIVFEPIKQNLKRDLKKWEEKSIKNSESARIRWNKTNANASERTERNANHSDKDTVTDNVNDNVKVNDNVNESEARVLKNYVWYKSQFDEVFLETMAVTHKGKDIQQAMLESFAHMAADKLRLNRADQSDCKKLLNTWLTNQKTKSNGTDKQTANLAANIQAFQDRWADKGK